MSTDTTTPTLVKETDRLLITPSGCELLTRLVHENPMPKKYMIDVIAILKIFDISFNGGMQVVPVSTLLIYINAMVQRLNTCPISPANSSFKRIQTRWPSLVAALRDFGYLASAP